MKPILITTSWDDGHTLDIRLADLLKKYAIKGTFYISPNDRESLSSERLTDPQIQSLSQDFEIGAHTMTHPRLTQITDAEARKEIVDSKKYLEMVTEKLVTSFCYPGGAYKKKHVAMVRDAGFTYARTTRRNSTAFSDRHLEAVTTVNTYNHYSDLWSIARFARFNPVKIVRYFHWDELAKARFDRVLQGGGEFHLWGHSWEIEAHNDWAKLESVLAYIAHKQNARYLTNSEVNALRPKKLLIAIPYFPPYHGGTQIYAYNIAKRLQNKLGWEVCIATSGEKGGPVVVDNYDGLKVYRLPYWFKISNTPVNFFWPFMLKKIIRDEHISIVNAHAPVPFMSDVIARLVGRRPLIVTYHTGTLKKTNNGSFFANTLIWLYELAPLHWLLRRTDFIVCPSDFVRLGFLKDYMYKSVTITPAVDMDIFKPGIQGAHPPTLLFVAGLTRSEQHKGLPVLIEAFNILHSEFPTLRLVVVGEGNMRSYYEADVKKLGLQEKISFKGKLANEALVNAYQQADIFVLPSLSPSESFGMVLVEAMATGIPVVGSRAGGIPLVIDHEQTGLLSDSGDPKALASAIKRLINDPVFAKEIGEAGRKKAALQYNWQNKAEQYSALFKSL